MSNPKSELTKKVIKCLVIDDEEIAIRGIVNHISKLDFLEVVATCSSAIEAAKILKEQEIDLMFLDINMPYLSGLEFLESLDKAPMTIFTTAYSEYALDGFRLNIIDYLLKPISFQRFFQAASKAHEIFNSQIEQNQENLSSDMYVRQADSFKRIDWKNILYIESMQNYLKLHFKEETIVIHQTMISMEDILPADAFFRIHKSYLVNVGYIDSISTVYLSINGVKLPISKHRRNELLNSVVYKKLISK